MKGLIDCVIVNKEGYFSITKVKSEDYEKYSKYIIGETVNGYKKLQFPEGISYMTSDGVLQAVGKVKPEVLERIKKMAETKEQRMNEIREKYKQENQNK